MFSWSYTACFIERNNMVWISSWSALPWIFSITSVKSCGDTSLPILWVIPTSPRYDKNAPKRSVSGSSWIRYNASALFLVNVCAADTFAKIIHSSISLCASLRVTGTILSILRWALNTNLLSCVSNSIAPRWLRVRFKARYISCKFLRWGNCSA